MQNIVTWGQNMSANIEEFACISMGGLFSGVPPRRTKAMTSEFTPKMTGKAGYCGDYLSFFEPLSHIVLVQL